MQEIHPSSSKARLPRYIAVYNALCEMIKPMQPGEKLPTEDELIHRFDVSRNTVRQAIQLMQEDRLVYKKQGAGTFVTRQPFMKGSSVNNYAPVEELLRRQNIDFQLEQTHVTLQDVDDLESEILGLPKGSPIYVFERIYTNTSPKGAVYAYLLDFVPPKTIAAAPTDAGVNELVRTVDEMGRSANCIVSATSAGKLYAGIFKEPPSTALLLLQQIVHGEREELLFFNKTYINSQVFELAVQLYRN
ncbi:GntR family transcriptional regulator [Oscillospiraceae bacterium MB08-C2-2]|nr:GntR family transcriptional regulator [Oscillospiraceae bacterium MB08-C2-2]